MHIIFLLFFLFLFVGIVLKILGFNPMSWWKVILYPTAAILGLAGFMVVSFLGFIVLLASLAK